MLRDFMFFFFFNDTATTEIYTLSLHDALPIFGPSVDFPITPKEHGTAFLFEHRHLWLRSRRQVAIARVRHERSEEHTSELQSRLHLVCRLLLEKKKRFY